MQEENRIKKACPFAFAKAKGPKKNTTSSEEMTKFIFFILLLIPSLVAASSPTDLVCSDFHRILNGIKHLKNEVGPASFELNGKRYKGCEVVFETKWSLIGKETDPESLFYATEGSALYRLGWRVDHKYTADGPGSTSYVIRKGSIACTVSWYFTAYIDEKTNKIVTGDELSGRIKCGTE